MTCGQERLEKLGVCSMKHNLAQQADVEKIVSRFSALAPRIVPSQTTVMFNETE